MLILKATISGKSYYFPLINPEKKYILGTKESCDFCLPFKGISRRHCEFFYKKNEWWVKDLDSTNGTYLDGEMIKEEKISENKILKCGIVSISIIKEPTSEWISKDGEEIFPSNFETNNNLKRKTDKISFEKKSDHLIVDCAKILISYESTDNKIMHMADILGIKNIQIIKKNTDGDLMIFSRKKVEGNQLHKIVDYLSSLEISIYPMIEEDKLKIACAFINLLCLEKTIQSPSPYININEKTDISSPLGVSKVAKSIWEKAIVYKDRNIPTLIIGETGVGKEFFARKLHSISNRANKLFLAINLAEYPDQLMQSELFGIEEKIATGVKGKIGKFEQANGGTILLDEIGDTTIGWQLMLLRILENNHFYRIGGTAPIFLDVKFIFLTNKDLKEEIKKGNIRDDFYYRINGVSFYLPPLRERKEDLEYFLLKYLKDLNEKYKTNINYSILAWDALMNYSWPGNLRELKFEIEKVFPLAIEKGKIQRDFLTIEKKEQEEKRLNFKEEVEKLEKELIIKAIKSTKNVTETIKLLKISRATFYQKVKKYNIKI